MHFILDKEQNNTLFEQAREQLLTALHMGKLRAGDRLPSVRQMSQRSNINIKTAFSIYQRLKAEGYIEMRTGSGAYVADIDRADLDQAYCFSIFRLIKSNISAAGQLKLDPGQYSDMVRNFIDKSQLASRQVAVVECNEEQVNLFAYEISKRLSVRVSPVLLRELETPDQRTSRVLARTDYFATTDYHFKQVKDLAGKYEKKILQLRLNPAFLPELIAAAGRGRVLMIVSNADFYPAFRNNLVKLGISTAILDRISAVDLSSLARARAGITRAQSFYISPICDQRVRKMLPRKFKEVALENMLSCESIEALEAVLLFHAR
ncbi:MAG TPA: GntR family transcriptional regulator [Blastocatellia bacterium]|nr:GntR family transcriptional regulator [Blastocatellia bacterium]